MVPPVASTLIFGNAQAGVLTKNAMSAIKAHLLLKSEIRNSKSEVRGFIIVNR
jgi:hypothetical protein